MKKKTTTSFMSTPSLQRALRAYAKKQNRSMGEVIRQFVAQGLKTKAKRCS